MAFDLSERIWRKEELLRQSWSSEGISYTGSRTGMLSIAVPSCPCHCSKEKTTAENDCVYASVTPESLLKPPVKVICSKMTIINWNTEIVDTDCFLLIVLRTIMPGHRGRVLGPSSNA